MFQGWAHSSTSGKKLGRGGVRTGKDMWGQDECWGFWILLPRSRKPYTWIGTLEIERPRPGHVWQIEFRSLFEYNCARNVNIYIYTWIYMICYIKKSYILKTRTGSCKGLEASQPLPWQGGAVTLEASWGHLLCVAYLTAGVFVWPTHYASVHISARLKVW